MTRLSQRKKKPSGPIQNLDDVLFQESPFDVRDVDHLAVVSRIWDDLGIGDIIDECWSCPVKPDKWCNLDLRGETSAGKAS